MQFAATSTYQKVLYAPLFALAEFRIVVISAVHFTDGPRVFLFPCLLNKLGMSAWAARVVGAGVVAELVDVEAMVLEVVGNKGVGMLLSAAGGCGDAVLGEGRCADAALGGGRCADAALGGGRCADAALSERGCGDAALGWGMCEEAALNTLNCQWALGGIARMLCTATILSLRHGAQ